MSDSDETLVRIVFCFFALIRFYHYNWNMGIYVNPENEMFVEALNSEIYVDKSLLLAELNKSIRAFTSMHVSFAGCGGY